MADVFKEVDEDLRRDKAAEWWKRYGAFVIGGAIAIVVAVAGYQGWRAYDEKQRGERSDSYAAALELAGSGQEERARQALAGLSAPDGGGYGLLAALTEARLAAEAGDLEAAERLWAGVAANASASPAVRDLGALFSVMRRLNDGDPATLRGELRPLAEPGAPYRYSALELLAALALRGGDTAAAREHLTQITDDPSAPAAARSRAAELLASLPG